MAEDEPGTIRAAEACRGLVAEQVRTRGGRIVDDVGDEIMAECASAVNAVAAALAVQAQLREGYERAPGLLLRIGVSLGEVVIRADRLYGDAVILAARVRTLARPGEVVLDESAARHVEGKLETALEDLGQHDVKNVSRPPRVAAHGGKGQHGDRRRQ